MNLQEKSAENIKYMVEKISQKLNIMNMGVMKPEQFDEESYEELREIYEMVEAKRQFSPSEMQAIAAELGTLRK
ncbi:DUF1128 domain-containing protein [Priestia endophytica]|uniref:DUF1128 domain-containing protein n=1 Tax=Priestia endophytica TaxID=135735 RepID=UPI000F51D431|nr:DUF1128 domain-containing protein [Priestia endophytica]MED4071705.1 DUF1128 domain-containing protein [Priestia endophytica]RPK07818.1 hypothetical protein FH5_05090 [Priestia endophytica]